ncbi:MAG: hypothetical protein DME59_11510 [Verrucomicrobia bacterium]|nr:MAG: hypothetical protein DME59_11510 [Verrucomicrobiota bacterium]PYL71884.1 MAG: hypothetical protein DMF26_18060 [Verrucomicrobiota bacterium]
MFLTSEGVDRLKELPVTTVGEKAARLLLELGREYPVPGESFWAPVLDVQTGFRKLDAYRGDDSLPDELVSDPVIINPAVARRCLCCRCKRTVLVFV